MKKDKILYLIAGGFFVLAVGAWYVYSLILPPETFPQNTLVTIDNGAYLSQISQQFEKDGLIKSAPVFVFFIKAMGLDKIVKSGEYFFEEPLSIPAMVERLIAAEFDLESIKVTILEGSTIKDISKKFEKFGNFDKEKFFELAEGKEGYLFPDTYYFLPNVTAGEVVAVMQKNFEKKMVKLNGSLENNKYDTKEVITMASLIEKEVSDPEDRRIVSGLLWKRMESGMPLQVDAVFPYIMNKYSLQLTREDLKIDSPYNTYKYKGLPPAPICNPGIDAILAALEPEKTPYWFYLSDKYGNTHFSATFDEHKNKKFKYLR